MSGAGYLEWRKWIGKTFSPEFKDIIRYVFDLIPPYVNSTFHSLGYLEVGSGEMLSIKELGNYCK